MLFVLVVCHLINHLMINPEERNFPLCICWSTIPILTSRKHGV